MKGNLEKLTQDTVCTIVYNGDVYTFTLYIVRRTNIGFASNDVRMSQNPTQNNSFVQMMNYQLSYIMIGWDWLFTI